MERTDKNAIIVARVSSSKQTENTSFETQHQAGMKLAREKGLNVVKYYEETNTGAGYLTRTETQMALSDLEAGLARFIIFYDFSRFSRDREFQAVMKRRIEAAGGKLLLCSQDFDDTPEGHLTFGLMGDLAAYERMKIHQRTANGRNQKLKQGVQVYRSHPSFGYHIVNKQDVLRGHYNKDQEGMYEVIPEQAEWVRKIYEMYASGRSLQYISRVLYEHNVATQQGGTHWDKATVKRLMRRTIYKGKCAVNKRRRIRDESRLARGLSEFYTVDVPAANWEYIDAPAIVSEELWAAANSRLDKGRTLAGRMDRKYVLAGLLFCPECARRMSGRRHKVRSGKREVYECVYSSKSRAAIGATCSRTQMIPAVDIEGEVIEALILVATRQDIIERAYKQYINDNTFDDSSTARLEADLKALEQKEGIAARKQVEAEMEGRSTAAYDSILQETAQKKTTLENQLRELQSVRKSKSNYQTKTQFLSSIVDDIATALKATGDILPSHEKNRLLSMVIERIEVDGNGICIQLKNDGLETARVEIRGADMDMKISRPEFNCDASINSRLTLGC